MKTGRHGIHLKFALWLLAAVIPVASASYFSVYFIDQHLAERIQIDLDNFRKLEANRINESLKEYTQASMSLAEGDEVQAFLGIVNAARAAQSDAPVFVQGFEGLQSVNINAEHPLQQLAESLLAKAKSFNSKIVEIKLVGTDESSLGYTPGFSWQPYRTTIVQDAMLTKKLLFGNVFRAGAGDDRIGIVAPVHDPAGVLAGALMVEAWINPVIDLVSAHEALGISSEAHIAQPTANGDAEFITPLRFKRDAAFNVVVPRDKNKPINTALESLGGRLLRDEDYRSTDSMLSVETIAATGWGLVVKIDTAEALAPVAKIKRLVSIAAVVCMLAIALGWFILINPLARRISCISSKASDIANRDFGVIIGDQVDDELGDMARSIDVMASELNEGTAIRVAVEERLLQRENCDELTLLYNRRYARGHAQQFHKQFPDLSSAALLFDLRGLGEVFDEAGEDVCDQILVEVAHLLRRSADEKVVLARWADTEFVALYSDVDRVEISLIHEELKRRLSDPIKTTNGLHRVDFNSEYTFAEQDETMQNALHEVDAKMRMQKHSQDFTSSRVSSAVNLIQKAMKHDRLELWLQPIMSHSSGAFELAGAECLVRLRAKDNSIVTPEVFLRFIENHPVSVQFDRCLIGKALDLYHRWYESGTVAPDFRLSFNITRRSLDDADLLAFIRNRLLQLNIPTKNIVLEIAAGEHPINDRALDQLRRLGVKLAVDGVGMKGFNLDQLLVLKPSIAKINHELIKPSKLSAKIEANPTASPLFEFCRSAGIEVIAKHIETESEIAKLQQLKLLAVQGNYFGEVVSTRMFAEHWGRSSGSSYAA